MIEAKNLSKAYNNVFVLNVPHLHIWQGESFGLVGNNGAGKTTLFSLIVDIIEATTGSVFSKGKEVTMSDHWKDYTGVYLDESFIIDFLTPIEYFEFIGSLQGFSPEKTQELYGMYSDFLNDDILTDRKYIRDLSKGNQKKVGIVGAMLKQPEILILDEPFPHLDPSSVIRLKRMLKEVNGNGCTLIISSHDLNHVTDVCNRIVLLEKGIMIKDITTNENTLNDLEQYFAVDSGDENNKHL